MNTFQHAKFEVGLYLAISKITWTLRGLVLKTDSHILPGLCTNLGYAMAWANLPLDQGANTVEEVKLWIISLQ